MNPDELDFLGNLKKEEKEDALDLISSLEDRRVGHFKKNVKAKEDRELFAEEELIRKKKYEEMRCEMPGLPRSTFLMVFSPDGTKVASTHGNHNIYVTDLRSGKNIKTLVGHPRTPWCIAFHPTSNQIVASGCLGGQVRIWDLSGGSEVWTAANPSVIASIAFHPTDRILVIATINVVYFWDWSKPEPFCHTATGNVKEKVRYVAFDKLGHKLITGISNCQNRWEYVRSSVPVSRQQERSSSPYRRRVTHRIYNFPSRHNTQPPPANSTTTTTTTTTTREPLSSVPERERNITMCYRNLVREYGRLVHRYLQLYRPPAMVDRGTDPMEPNNTSGTNSSRVAEPPAPSTNLSAPPTDSELASTSQVPMNSNHNPYQLLTPSRILAVMQRPPTLIRATQTAESRKHKAETSPNLEEQGGIKKIKNNQGDASTSSQEPGVSMTESRKQKAEADTDLDEQGGCKKIKIDEAVTSSSSTEPEASTTECRAQKAQFNSNDCKVTSGTPEVEPSTTECRTVLDEQGSDEVSSSTPEAETSTTEYEKHEERCTTYLEEENSSNKNETNEEQTSSPEPVASMAESTEQSAKEEKDSSGKLKNTAVSCGPSTSMATTCRNQNDSTCTVDSAQPGPSTSSEDSSKPKSERERLLDYIIRHSSLFRLGDNMAKASRPPNVAGRVTNTKSVPQQQGSSSTQQSRASTSNAIPRPGCKSSLLCLLNKLPKISKATQKSSRNRSEDSSTSNKSDSERSAEENNQKGTSKKIEVNSAEAASSNPDLGTQNEVGTAETTESTHLADSRLENSQERTVPDSTPIDYSMPGTSNDSTSRGDAPREAKRLEVMMMSIRRNAEEKLRCRFLPLIRSVPENDRLELVRLFEQGVKESREKARLRYRNMGQMLNKKTNRRPVLDTSSDTTSSEDEPEPLRTNIFNQSNPIDLSRTDDSLNLPSTSSGAGRSQGRSEGTGTDAYHNINNLENWVTSLFNDIDNQTTSGENGATSPNNSPASGSTTQTSCAVIDTLLNRPTRSYASERVHRFYDEWIRDMDTPSVPPPPPVMTRRSSTTPVSSPSVTRTASTVTRTANSSFSSFGRRRLGSRRVSAFLPPRLHYPRPLSDIRRNRHFSVGRWRIYHNSPSSHYVGSRLPPSTVANNSNSATDEVINFSELPNSEDDPVISGDARPSNPPPYYPLHFHPFNPPPDLPAINPENIGIGNMYSSIVQDLETSLNDVRNIRAANRPGEMSDMLNNFSERLENIMNQSENILRNLRSSVELLPGNESSDNGQNASVPTVSFNDSNFYIRDQRTDGNDAERNIGGLLGENPPSNVTSDHTYPRNSDASVSPSSSSETMSPLMTSLHLTISHIQRQARLLRQQVESIERIDRAMVEVAQLQLMRLLLVELSRYVRNALGESRSTCMSSVRQMMAGTRISDSSPSESQSNDNDTTRAQTSQSTSASTSSDASSAPTSRTRGITHKTYPPSRMSRMQRQHFRRATLIHHMPRRYTLRVPPRNAPSAISSSTSLNLDHQSTLHMYSRINTFTLNRMSRRLDELINEQVRIFTQRSFSRVPPRIPGGNMGEQNLAMRLRNSITRTNRLVGNIFDANVVRNYTIDPTTVSRDGVDRFNARQTLSFIIDGISAHLDESRVSSLPCNVRIQLLGVMTMSMLLSELLLLHIVDSIPPPTDMNLDQERQSLINRIDQMCSTITLTSRYGGYSTNLTHSLRQLQSMIRQSSTQSTNNVTDRRRPVSSHPRSQEPRSRSWHRPFGINSSNRARRPLYTVPNRARERPNITQVLVSDTQHNRNVNRLTQDRETLEGMIRRMTNSLQALYDRSDEPAEPLNEEQEFAEARARYHRMVMRDRMLSQNQFGVFTDQPLSLTVDSDDFTRQSGTGPRENSQVAGPSSEFGRLPSTMHLPNPERINDRMFDDRQLDDRQPSRPLSDFRRNYPSNSTASGSSVDLGLWSSTSRWPWNVIPAVQVNDVPVSDLGPSQDSSESDNNGNAGVNNINNNNNNNNNFHTSRGVWARLAAIRTVTNPLGVFRPRFLHPLYASVNPFDADLDDPQREHIYDSDVITTVTPNHRIQVWDISESVVPVINNPLKNVVVSECKIHNDASVDVASDGSILVTLLPSGGYLNVTNRLGVYSLKWETLGQCLYTTNFDHNAVSVSLSPLSRHLVVGLASRRASIVPSDRWIMATIFKIEQKDMPGDRLPIVRRLEQSRDGRATSHKSVNCIRWLPTSGQGLIYATNTGQLVIWT